MASQLCRDNNKERSHAATAITVLQYLYLVHPDKMMIVMIIYNYGNIGNNFRCFIELLLEAVSLPIAR